jgi:zinc transporter 1/2/3
MDSNNLVKISFIIVSFLEALLMGLIPLKSKSFKESPRLLGVANAFSGGVFLAIALMHIMPEQVNNYNELWEENHPSSEDEDNDPFPMPFLLLVIGYTLILSIDKVIFDTHDILGDEHGHAVHDALVFNDPKVRKASEALHESMKNFEHNTVNGN